MMANGGVCGQKEERRKENRFGSPSFILLIEILVKMASRS
jgi:hypothetical protein